MKKIRNLLIAVISIELAVSCYFAAVSMSRPNPPTVDMQRLDPITSADLEEFRVRVQEGREGAWRELAEAFLGNGYYVAAEQCFRQAAELDPTDFQARYGRGFCLERIGQTSTAIQVLKATVQDANPELATTCWYQIGRCYLRVENEVEAEKAFRKISEFQPAGYNLAKLLIRSNRAEEAIRIVEQQLADIPNSLKLIQLRMHAAEALGDDDLVAILRDMEDRSQYQVILEYGQSFISMFAARQGLAALLSKALRLKTEGTLIERQKALEPALRVIRSNNLWQFRSVLIAAAQVEVGLGNLKVGNELLAEIEQHTQGGVDVLDLQAQVAESEGDYESAYKLRLRVASMKPTSEIYLTLSETKVGINDSIRRQHQAMSNLRAAIEAWQYNQITAAEQALQRCEKTLGENELFLFYDGEIKRALGHRDEALKAYEKCLSVNPDHGRSLVRKQQLLKSSISSTREGEQP